MKNLLVLFLSLLSLTANSQGVMYEIQGNYNRRITKEELSKANLISDFVHGYPDSWITNYVSVEISARCNGKDLKAQGYNNILTPNQKNLLVSADVSSKIIVDVKYRYPNPATDLVMIRNANMTVTVVPFAEAKFPGGDRGLKKYFKDSGIEDFAKLIAEKEENVKVFFVINEKGKTSTVKILESCKDAEMNQKILEAIEKMPAWKPAENSNGDKVKQEFEFRVLGMDGC